MRFPLYVLALSRASLEETEKRLNEIPADLCAPFYAEAGTLERQLLSVYRTVALCVRKEDNLDVVAEWWGTMVQVCDEFLARLLRLCEEHPASGASIFYDRVLDLRSRCQRLMTLHSLQTAFAGGG